MGVLKPVKIKKIQINNKLPVFTFKIDKEKDKICNVEKSVRK